jgi:uncharacterized spore protein YtfJ
MMTDAQEQHAIPMPTDSAQIPGTSGMVAEAAGLLERLAERLGGRASVSNVFGEPVTRGDVTVIPVARVTIGLGGGSGRERGAAKSGEGLGAGGGVLARPAGFIEIRDGKAVFVPIRDQRAETLRGITTIIAGLSASRIARGLVRRRRTDAD